MDVTVNSMLLTEGEFKSNLDVDSPHFSSLSLWQVCPLPSPFTSPLPQHLSFPSTDGEQSTGESTPELVSHCRFHSPLLSRKLTTSSRLSPFQAVTIFLLLYAKVVNGDSTGSLTTQLSQRWREFLVQRLWQRKVFASEMTTKISLPLQNLNLPSEGLLSTSFSLVLKLYPTFRSYSLFCCHFL